MTVDEPWTKPKQERVRELADIFKKGAAELWIYQAGLRRRRPDLSIVSPGTAWSRKVKIETPAVRGTENGPPLVRATPNR